MNNLFVVCLLLLAGFSSNALAGVQSRQAVGPDIEIYDGDGCGGAVQARHAVGPDVSNIISNSHNVDVNSNQNVEVANILDLNAK